MKIGIIGIIDGFLTPRRMLAGGAGPAALEPGRLRRAVQGYSLTFRSQSQADNRLSPGQSQSSRG